MLQYGTGSILDCATPTAKPNPLSVTSKMNDWIQVEEEQKEICRKLNVDWTPLDKKLMVAVNESLFTDIQPVNGLRHLKLESIDGLYLWSGEEIPQDDNSFFKPIHTEHLIKKKKHT